VFWKPIAQRSLREVVSMQWGVREKRNEGGGGKHWAGNENLRTKNGLVTGGGENKINRIEIPRSIKPEAIQREKKKKNAWPFGKRLRGFNERFINGGEDWNTKKTQEKVQGNGCGPEKKEVEREKRERDLIHPSPTQVGKKKWSQYWPEKKEDSDPSAQARSEEVRARRRLRNHDHRKGK